MVLITDKLTKKNITSEKLRRTSETKKNFSGRQKWIKLRRDRPNLSGTQQQAARNAGHVPRAAIKGSTFEK